MAIKQDIIYTHLIFVMVQAFWVVILWGSPLMITPTMMTGYAHGRVLRELRDKHKNGRDTDAGGAQ